MRKRQTSISALGIATVRALESERPEGDRLYVDPYARQFIPGWLYTLIKVFDRMGYAAEGLDQVVILGAGLDARALRIDALKALRVFEVDHPASQASKLRKLRKILIALPDHVTYVGVDLNTQSLETRLLGSGYNPAARTGFVWQGVTQYLTPDAVDATLAFITNRSGPGSAVVFDYIEPFVLTDAGSHGEVRRMRRFRWLSGETLTFGIPITKIEAFLTLRGFVNVVNVDGPWLQAHYLADRRQPVANNYGIVWARVPSTSRPTARA
ncbi:MAG: SAM-dependent methyltransferase [Anaerolineae bacterium]|nr:SAM-dependent methyltransferase [Anaerolineae bacterium]